MKYKTFAALRAGAVTLLLAGGFLGCRAMNGARQSTSGAPAAAVGNVPNPADYTVNVPPAGVPPQAGQTPASGGTPAGKKGKTSAGGGATEPLEGWQKEVISMQKQPLTNGETKNGSRKWVVNGGGMHAEFRSDTDKGATTWNRVKVDLNDNKRDDERWDFKSDGSIKRRVAPSDDENFTETYTLKGNQWVRK